MKLITVLICTLALCWPMSAQRTPAAANNRTATSSGSALQVAPGKPGQFNYAPEFRSLGVNPGRLALIDSLLQDYIRRGVLPHALTFVARKGQVVHHKAFGYRNLETREPLSKNNIFVMMSQTKAIVTAALMTYYEEGKFQLDDPVSMYIPEVSDQVLTELKDDGSYTTRPARSKMTIRHLLCHTSGFTAGRAASLARRPQGSTTLAEDMKRLAALPLGFDPGTEWNYNPSSDLMAYVLEVISGKSVWDAVRERVLDPLGIKDMAYYFDESYRERFVVPYNAGSNGTLTPMGYGSRDPFGPERTYFNGAYGMHGTIEGYARFCQMILNGGTFNGKRVLGRKTIELMSQDNLPHPNSGGAHFGFGLGFQVYLPDEQRISMITPGSLSWGGAYNTDYLIDPREDLIVLLYTNRRPDTKVWEKFLNVVYQALE